MRSKGGLSHGMSARCTRRTREMALEAARDIYTRRMEGVSLWVVPSAQITASDPGEAAAAVRAGRGQGLPPPDFLSHPRPHEAHLMASLPPIDTPSGATGAGVFDAPARDENDALFDFLLRLGDDS